ncbi:MAG: hypothetical protein A4S09_17680 [Proteobacteria bacterium SG_bin7]|nr:MAG: hypothetical protein A4S09_17680 [Proteobacteria bacterium SG_bin7]
MIDFTKSEKQELRNLANEAYKVELARELEILRSAFTSWQNGKIGVFELDEKIHEYHSGPHKQLYVYYQMKNQPEAMIARALALGLIESNCVPDGIKNKLERLVGFFRENG